MKYAIVLLCLPVAGWAECPKGADLAQGIVIRYGDGAVETFRQTAPGIVTATYVATDGFSSESLLSQGIYLVQTQDIVNARPDPQTRVTYTYPLPPGAMPLPEAGGSWSATVRTVDGAETYDDLHEMRFEAETTLSIGACSYRMLPVEVRYGDDGELLHYLPDLGIAPVGAWGVGDMRESMIYTAIGRAPR